MSHVGSVLTYRNGRFELHGVSAQDKAPKGFDWSENNKVWWTNYPPAAKSLERLADERAKKKLYKIFLHQTTSTNPKILCRVIPPSLFITLKLYQIEAVVSLLSRNRAYLAADPGVGKTLIALTMAIALKRPFCYIAPPALIKNVKAEIKKFGLKTHLPKGSLIVPDSMLIKRWHVIRKWSSQIKGTVLFVDESHRVKNLDARRSKALFKGIMPVFDRTYFLSGTPMPNRPMELFSVLHYAAPETIDFMDAHRFGVKYCGGFMNERGDWDFTGASNLDELSARIKPAFMLRLKKQEVLSLPPKHEKILEFDFNPMDQELSFLEKRLSTQFDFDKEKEASLLKSINKSEKSPELSTYRRLLAESKANHPSVIKAIKDRIEKHQKLIVFGVHLDALKSLFCHLIWYSPILITGQTPVADRLKLVDEFQDKTTPSVLIGNIQALGTGLNITACNRGVFLEAQWSPGDNEQAGDRMYRIGQTKAVTLEYFCYRNSIDMKVIASNLRKRKNQAFI